ncbi:nucleotide exchange factor GrpE [Adlercreutzia sp. ZJ141]|uniref:nucleotide exchange factor GrpE n=1 Tax=Adlercreutzia sp. ZJ141 TaxID=2709406 RepID=UPI0013EC8E91|nr:nucleotide exchange factor GrpE [Adlercreutzia sp. ZJ141]
MTQQPNNSTRDSEARATARQIPIDDVEEPMADAVLPATENVDHGGDSTSSSEDAASVEPADPSGSAEAAADCDNEHDEVHDEEQGESDVVREAEEVLEQADAQQSSDELIAAAQAEAKEWQDKFMRLHAEWDTYRRRMNEQREVEKARAAEKLVMGLIPVIDDFERTIDFAANNGEADLLDGVKAVHAKFVDVLVKDGVQVIDPAGEPYDALEAQAVATVPNTDVPDETVADVYQKGYKMGAKVLRPAMVTVTTGGPKREKPAAEE